MAPCNAIYCTYCRMMENKESRRRKEILERDFFGSQLFSLFFLSLLPEEKEARMRNVKTTPLGIFRLKFQDNALIGLGFGMFPYFFLKK